MADVWMLDMNTVNAFCWYKDVFTSAELNLMTEMSDKLFIQDARVGGNGNEEGEVKDSIRKTKIGWVGVSDPSNQWLYRKLTDITNNANQAWFQFDLRHIESLQYTMYEPDMYYDKHIDTMFQSIGLYPRKLSFSLQLSDPSEYEGGDLLIHNGMEPIIANKEKGSITFFPSYSLHEVTPVTKGLRKCLVGWVHGPKWK